MPRLRNVFPVARERLRKILGDLSDLDAVTAVTESKDNTVLAALRCRRRNCNRKESLLLKIPGMDKHDSTAHPNNLCPTGKEAASA